MTSWFKQSYRLEGNTKGGTTEAEPIRLELRS